MRELILGPKRFTDLRAGMPHAGPNVLAQRLRELQEAGIVERQKLPPPAASQVYALTEWGQDLEPLVLDLGRWASRSPMLRHDAHMSIDSLVLSFRTMFSRDAAAGLSAHYELRFGEDRFRLKIENGTLDVERGAAADPDAIVASGPDTLASFVYGGRPFAEATASGALRFERDREVVAWSRGCWVSFRCRPRFGFPLLIRTRRAPRPGNGRTGREAVCVSAGRGLAYTSYASLQSVRRDRPLHVFVDWVGPY